jgi:hypothetical protein
MRREAVAASFLLLSACAHVPRFTLAERLAQLPLEVPGAAASEADQLIQRSLEQETESLRIEMPPDLPVLVLKQDATISPRILPPHSPFRFVFVSAGDLAALTKDYGELRYVAITARLDQQDRAEVSIEVGLSVPPKALSLCCGGRIFGYRKEKGRWAQEPGIREFFD